MRLVLSTRRSLACLVLVAACSGGGDGGTTPPPPPTVASVGVSLASASLAVGQSTTATATARDAAGATISGKTPNWSSSSTAVATVDGNGTVTAVAAGSANIIATIDGRTGQATLTVTPPPVATVAVTLSASTLSIGQTTQAVAVLRDAAGATLSGRTISWTSSATAVATVSAAGLVSAVGAGSATITANSEGRSGTATVTVTPAVTLTGLSLRGANGQPLDTTNVAGRIQVSVDENVPAGFRGVREIRVGTVVLARDSVVGASSTLARVAPVNRSLDTATPVATISGDVLRSTPLLLNGQYPLSVVLTGAVGNNPPTSTSLQTSVTLRNQDVVRIYGRPARTTLINGRTVWSGDTEVYIEDLAFSGVDLNSVQVITSPASAIYGSVPTSGVVDIITRTSPDIGRRFTVSTGTTAFESPLVGTRFLIRSLTRGGVTVNLGAIPQLGGNAPSVDGSLLYTPPSAAAGITLPSGVRYQLTGDLPAGVLPSGFVSLGSAVSIDNLAPRAGASAFAPPQRNTVVGTRAWSVTGEIGLSGNYLGVSTDLKAFVDYAGFTDDLAGVDPAAPVTYYASTSKASLFNTNNVITSVSAIPATSNLDWFLGASLTDRAGNRGTYIAQTNAANPFGDGTDAKFGRLTQAGALTATGLDNGVAWGVSNLSVSPVLNLRATGSRFPLNALYGVVYKYNDPTACYVGFGTQCDVGEVLGGTLSNNGTQSDFGLSLATLRSRRAAAEGGDGDGLFSGFYWAGDLGGNWATAPYPAGQPFNVLVDRTPPMPAITAMFPSPGTVTATARLMDDIAVAGGEVGLRFNWTNSLFTGGKLFAPLDAFPIGGNLTSGLSTDASVSWTAPIITTGRFFDRLTGAFTSTAFLSDGAYFRGYDYARNGVNTFLPYTNPGPVEPAPASVQNILFTLSAASVCNGTGCAGVPSTVTAQVDILSSLNVPPIEKMALTGIPSNGQPY
ncbi:MAG: Ig-like domain-containing protein, partial [Gemmatimonadetes bacterium]|nr:Ig-like domain-containing protein [Gemmatimonadota bacterium]